MSMEKEFLNHLKAHQGILHKVCFTYTNDRDEFQDLFQEIMYQLWKSYDKFRAESKVSTWMYKVALFTALAYLKKKSRLPTKHVDVLPDVQIDEPGNEQLDQLKAAMTILSDTDKAILMLYLEDHSYQQMAEILGITESNVGVKLNRIKGKLRKQVGN